MAPHAQTRRRGRGGCAAAGVMVAAAATPGAEASVSLKHRRLKIVNGCATAPMWIAHIAGNGHIPDQQNVRIDPGSSHHFVTSGNISATRYWPKMDCDATGSNCGIGGSGGPGQGCVARTPDYTSCAPPIDSKFEATWGEDDKVCDPTAPGGTGMEGCDYVDMSLVDGFTLPFKLDIHGHCVSAGKESDVESIDCSALTSEICPDRELISELQTTISLKAVNPNTNQVAGCYSPCKKLTDPKWGNVLGQHDDADPGVSKYCCPTPPEEPDTCRAGPIKDTIWLDIVHNYCPGVYGYAYDDGMGLLRCDATSRYTVTFYCPHDVQAPATQPMGTTTPVVVVTTLPPPHMNGLQAFLYRIQSALSSLRSRLSRQDSLQGQRALRKELEEPASRPAPLRSGAAAALVAAAAAAMLAAVGFRSRGRQPPASQQPASREASQDEEGSLLMHAVHQRSPSH